MRSKVYTGVVLLLVAVAAAAGCMQKEATTLQVAPAQVTISSLAPENQVRLQVKALNAKGVEIPNKAIRYSSSDPTVLDVDSTGLLTPKKSGNAVVTVQADKVSQTVPVTVSIPATIKLTEDIVEIDVGQNKIIEAQILDEAGNPVDGEIVWVVTNPEVASIDSSGSVSGVAAGETTATASAGNLSSSVNVKVKEPAPSEATAPEAAAQQTGGTEQVPAQ